MTAPAAPGPDWPPEGTRPWYAADLATMADVGGRLQVVLGLGAEPVRSVRLSFDADGLPLVTVERHLLLAEAQALGLVAA